MDSKTLLNRFRWFRKKPVIKNDRMDSGREVLDPQPLAATLKHFRPPPTLQEQVARYMYQAQLLALQNGHETFEEAEDFDCGDEDASEFESNWEVEYDPLLGRDAYKQESQMVREDVKKFDDFVAQRRKKKFTNNPKVKKEDPPDDKE